MSDKKIIYKRVKMELLPQVLTQCENYCRDLRGIGIPTKKGAEKKMLSLYRDHILRDVFEEDFNLFDGRIKTASKSLLEQLMAIQSEDLEEIKNSMHNDSSLAGQVFRIGLKHCDAELEHMLKEEIQGECKKIEDEWVSSFVADQLEVVKEILTDELKEREEKFNSINCSFAFAYQQ